MSSIASTATLGSYDSYQSYYASLIATNTPPDSAFMREFYRLLWAYYQQNGLYDFISRELTATQTSGHSIKPIRNPSWRVVEFYAGKLFPGTLPDGLPILTDNESIIDPIHKIWQWSNLNQKKQQWSRWFAIYGDWFLKVNNNEDRTRVWTNIIKPENVTHFELDERGFLEYIRMDFPIVDNESESPIERVFTEVWDKRLQEVAIWNHTQGVDEKLSRLGDPQSVSTFQELHNENFIPIVYSAFRDDGEGRANGAYTAQLDKIDEVNRQATRLAQILFRYKRALWVATSNAVDASGRPVPPTDLSDMLNSDDELTFLDDDIISLPGMSDIKSLVPQINFGDALQVLESQVEELREDLPELSYYSLREQELSGRAIRFMLDDVITKVEEARGNAEAALKRADEIALTVAQNFELEGFSEGEIGTYEKGDFEHSFAGRAVLPQTIDDRADVIQKLTSAGASIFAAAIAAGLTEQEAGQLAQVDLFGFESGAA